MQGVSPSVEHKTPAPREDASPGEEHRNAGLALASTFAEALARKHDLFEGLQEALARCLETGLLSAGCFYEAVPEGGLSRCAHAGVPGAGARLSALCDQAWLADSLLAAGLPLTVAATTGAAGAATEILRHTGATSALLAPLNAHGARLGLMVLASRDVDVADERFAGGARIVAAMVARALADAQARGRSEAAARLERAAFAHAQDAVLILDDDGRVLAANGRAEHVLDRSVSELLGRQPLELVVPEDRQVVHALRTQLVAQGSLAPHRVRVSRPDGGVVDVDATAARVPHEGGFLRVLVLRDMTRRRGAREGLAAGEARFRALVETTGDTTFTLDHDLRVTSVFGCRPTDVFGTATAVGKPLREALRAATDVHEPAARRALAGETTTFEWTAPGPDDTRHLQTSFSPMRGSDGAVRCVVGVTRDVTERRQQQGQLLVANHMAALGLLAGSVSQDLGTPVAAVLTNLSHVNHMLAGMYGLDLAGERAVDLAALMHLGDAVRDALSAADQLRRIVQELRSFTRASEERLGPVDVSQVLETAVRMAANALKGRALVVRQYQEEPVALGNEARLVQVFINLVVNAAQACEEANDGHPEIHLTIRRDDEGRVIATVRDNGPGIAPEHLGRIFEPFFTTKVAGVGTGLGLSLAQRIVQSLGGQIEVESQVGKGTTVRVTLPPADPAAQHHDGAPAATVTAPPGL